MIKKIKKNEAPQHPTALTKCWFPLIPYPRAPATQILYEEIALVIADSLTLPPDVPGMKHFLGMEKPYGQKGKVDKVKVPRLKFEELELEDAFFVWRVLRELEIEIIQAVLVLFWDFFGTWHL